MSAGRMPEVSQPITRVTWPSQITWPSQRVVAGLPMNPARKGAIGALEDCHRAASEMFSNRR